MITPQPIEVWSATIDNQPGELLDRLEKLAVGEVDPQFLLVRPAPDDPQRSVVLISPVTGPTERSRAQLAGFAPDTNWHFLRVEGTDEHGTALRVTEALTEVGVQADAMLLSAIDSRLLVFLGFHQDHDAKSALHRLEHSI